MHIILIHGMGRSPLSMGLLGRRLGNAGHHVHYFPYVAALEGFASCRARLEHFIIRRSAGDAYVIVAHSLGSVLFRAALPHMPIPPAACFFLAPPMVACRFARTLKDFRFYRLLTGEMGQKLADPAFMANLPLPFHCRIFAGDGGPRWRFWPCGDEPNDGILGVSETRYPDIPHVTQPAIHTFIMNDPNITRAILSASASAS